MESLIGKTIDNYKFIEVIGRGGMGVVFKAMDTNLEKIVAIKVIDPYLARDENFVRRFKTEARALAKLENPNIVTVYALRETSVGFLMVMEYVEPRPLSQSLQESGPFQVKDIIDITKQLLNAIGHAHKVGVIHRDIKPSNILLRSNGRIKVTDFGLAKVVQQKGPASTITQARAGTLYYMSPEQVKGLKNVDTRSDLYSLGMTVYEMTAGRTPFEKTDTEFTIQRKIVDGEIPSIIKFNPNVPRKLTKIITKAINKEPEKRYQNADEMLEDIQNFEKELAEKEHKVEKKKLVDFANKRMVIAFSSIIILLALTFLYFVISPFGNSKKESFLSILTIPSDAEVSFDGLSVGKSPIKKYKFKNEGNVKVKISKYGFSSVDTSLNIKLGNEETITFTLGSAPKVQVSINTNPADAKLFIADSFIGQSPIDNFPLIIGENQLRIKKEGYLNIDTIISVGTNLSRSFKFELSKDPNFVQLGILSIRTNPSGASIYLDGEFQGSTPMEIRNLGSRFYRLTLKKRDYIDVSENIRLEANNTTVIRRELVRESIRMSEIEILVRPYGSIYVDGQLKRTDTSSPYNDSLSVGVHTIKIIHPSKPIYEKRINVNENPEKLIINFERKLILTVTSEPSSAEIFINNKSTGFYTPKELILSPGNHKIQVVKEGYSSLPQEKIYNVSSEIYEEIRDRKEKFSVKLEKIQ